MTILGIETSCDETAVALVTPEKKILSHEIWSHLPEHQRFGGVVPEISARAHLKRLEPLIRDAFSTANLSPKDVIGIAATCGPGLLGGVLVGALMGKAMASALNKPFFPVNHLAAHALTVRLFEDIAFPYLLLLVSGGHCQLLVVHSPLDYVLLGQTLDDALGETFDKVGKMLGFSYPAGPQIEKRAQKGNPHAYGLPRPLMHRKGSCDFSFSGLKTAVRHLVHSRPSWSWEEKNDLCASFQYAVAEILKNRTHNALHICEQGAIPLTAVVVAGGVAANRYLLQELQGLLKARALPLKAPPVMYCTDNGAMVAWAGVEMLRQDVKSVLDFDPRPRWPLEGLRDSLEP